jgi:hypothetical protein
MRVQQVRTRAEVQRYVEFADEAYRDVAAWGPARHPSPNGAAERRERIRGPIAGPAVLAA